MAPFCGWGSTASRLQPLREGSLLFTIQFPEIPGTHFIISTNNINKVKQNIYSFPKEAVIHLQHPISM